MDESMIGMMNADISRRAGLGNRSNFVFVGEQGHGGGKCARLLLVFIVSWLVLSLASYHCMMMNHKKKSGSPCTNPLLKKKYIQGSGCAAMCFALVITLIVYFCSGSEANNRADWF